MAQGPVSEVSIKEALKDFQDPETGRDIVTLGQLHGLEFRDGCLSVTLGLTTFSAPLWDQLRVELAEHLRSRLPELNQVRLEVRVEEHERPAETVGSIGLAAKAILAVGSGKGGVGKSTIAAILACGLSRAGCKVGLMDADVYGPSIPHLLGCAQRPVITGNRIRPVRVDDLAMMSMGLLVPPGEAVIWRGPMLHGAISQFLKDTEWGNLDYLIIDMPPGTGDVAITLSQVLPVSAAVVVTTPQDVALLDVVKAIAMFRRVKIEVVGMVENMSYFVCPECQTRHDVFGSGGGRRQADELDVPFLGEVPLNTSIRVCGDEGRVRASFDDPMLSPCLEALCRSLVKALVDRRRRQPSLPSLPVIS
ncbi:MAG TPA: iron-sulfur cluster carrier protein ApbC [Planctomycetaceae bacterium]|nr:iron-sulfur cluster carrier protein ApbC [Planctomycetaceae bacterium]HIQ22952.1 iron-sulfur cluster carrier protein ApbC [Planctomycetota bacterium]